MAYTRKLWENRNTENKNRRILTDVDTGEIQVVEVGRDEGAIYTDGDPFNAATMNNLEQRIADGFSDSANDLDSAVSSLTSKINADISNLSTTTTTSISSAIQNAKTYIKPANGITNTGWSTGDGYYQKTTGQTIPTGYDAIYIGVNILDDATATNLSQSVFIRAVNISNTVYLRVGAVPNGTINIGLAFIQTRYS